MKLLKKITFTKMISAKNKQIAVNWLQAFNSKNLENLLSLYHPQALHYSPKLKIAKPETEGLIKGKKELEMWWKEAFVRLPGLQYIATRFTADEEQVFIEYVRKVPGEKDLLVGEVLEIKEGLIVYSRVYHG
jgi:hypothetical protein